MDDDDDDDDDDVKADRLQQSEGVGGPSAMLCYALATQTTR